MCLGECTELTSLPEKLQVGGTLWLDGCTSLTSLPTGLKVGRNLRLGGCTSLTSLPVDLWVGRGLFLNGCTSLTSLPVDLRVRDSITLPDDFPADAAREAQRYDGLGFRAKENIREFLRSRGPEVQPADQ